MMKNIFQDLKRKDHKRYLGGLDVFKYIGPGLLVTVGFIDPGNWASNFAAGSEFGYSLLWVVTLSTIMLIVLQHNVAHLGIVTGLCLSEAATKYTPKWVSRPILGTAVLASISTSLAEILGGAIALEMLFDMPIMWGAVLTTLFVSIMLFTNSYKKIERSIIAFVSVIGLSFIYELFLVEIDWPAATMGWVTPAFPKGSMLIIMSVLGAVVMPHNLFLHSEVIQKFILSREVAGLTKPRDYKTALQELVQRESGQVLAYQLVGEEGPDHDKRFFVEVDLNGTPVGSGQGRSKKEAEQMAAKAAIGKLGG